MNNSEQKKMQDEKQEQRAEKKPYKTPRLTGLGTVKEMTLGTPPSLFPDVFGAST